MFSSSHTIRAIRVLCYKNCTYRSFSTQAQSKNRQTIDNQEDLSSLTRNVDKIQAIEKDLKAIHEFNEGINLQQQGKYGPAHELLKRVLDILEMGQQNGAPAHIYILQK